MSPEVLDAPVAAVPVDFDSTETNSENALQNSPLIDQLSEPSVGKWNILVSHTNWEKGAIILSWRNELIAAGLPNIAYSDEAWAKRVGNVSAQHVGRLRRTAERFGEANRNYAGLYWSHFHAAIDWDDAEIWLEGAVQKNWSVAQMRVQRWDTIGASDDLKPRETDVFTSEIDEDVYSSQSDRIEGRTVEIGAVDALDGRDATPSVAIPVAEPPKKKEQPKKEKRKPSESNVPTTGELLMSLKGIAKFPADLAESLELLKVALLNHKLAGWKSVSAEQVCRSLETLKMLTVAKD
jgi:hypothetical protein